MTARSASLAALACLAQASPELNKLIDSTEAIQALVKRAKQLISGGTVISKPASVRSIFSYLKSHNSKLSWHNVPLALNESVLFPSDKPVSADAKWGTSLAQAFEQARSTAFDDLSQIESLLGILQAQAWSTPSDIAEDIALYDALRIQAALASCLSFVQQDETLAYLVEGDISGVQRFLYTIPSSGAAKQLRARSLYLQLLTEAVARHLLRQYELPITNLIYAGGGHFYLLLPAHLELNTFQNAIDQILLKHHDGELYIALGAVALREQDFKADAFSNKWSELKRETGKAKGRRYGSLDTQTLHVQVFSPRVLEDELGKRYSDRDERETGTSDERPRAESSMGQSFEALGRQLTNADYLIFYEVATQSCSVGGYEQVLKELGMSLGLLDERGQSLGDTSAQIEAERAIVFGMRQYPETRLLKALVNHGATQALPTAGRSRYVVNQVARKNTHGIAEFSDLANAAEGIKRLGVLRMDVDDLGTLFKDGFIDAKGNRNASLTRVASLSTALSLFFEGWVGALCEKYNYEYRAKIESSQGTSDVVEAIYAVYSGGDDLFIVGRWDILPQLAHRISHDFARFACGNPHVHISAGITLHTGKYPLYQAADDAEDALKAAKKLTDKNAFSFLDLCVKWQEWDVLIQLREGIIHLSEQEKIGRAIFQTLLQFYKAHVDAQKTSTNGDKVVWGAHLWRTAYQLARLVERAKDQREVLAPFLQDALNPTNAPHAITHIGLAARWADILTRKRQEN